jgi:peptidoglycan/xylan/chitin deacetylase (PgdA/CDA1 family)
MTDHRKFTMSIFTQSVWLEKGSRARCDEVIAVLQGRVARVVAWLIVLALAPLSSALASDVLFVTKAASDEVTSQVLRVSELYGLSVQSVLIRVLPDGTDLTKRINQENPVAVILSADALGDLDRVSTLRSLKRLDKSTIPLLIVATGSQQESSQLSLWTNGRIIDCKPIEDHLEEWSLTFAGDMNSLSQLAGLSVKSASSPDCGFLLSNGSHRILTEAQSGTEHVPIMVDLSTEMQPLFAVSAMRPQVKMGWSGIPSLQEAFSNIAGMMIFIRNAAGDRAWHPPGHFANLTIDDPWLTEPYGNLRYEALLREMEQHNFHATIAFVPWNYDRSKPSVASLFQRHPDRFSICIHGNNHNHREFGDYATQPFARQKEDIGQALARMEKFTQLTALPYDKVMVFPHAVAPEQTFEILKRYGYWATVNSENVPLGSVAPNDPLFPFRPWTLAFGGFPSIKRVSAEIPISSTNIAINGFLENPQLFYIHQEYFEGGIGAFNAIAEDVNRLEPSVEWKSLGYIVRHLYLIRVTSDRDYEVLAISSNLELSNSTSRAVVFHVHRPKDSTTPPRSVIVNGTPIPYKITSGDLQFDIILAPNEIGNVEISYDDHLDLASLDVSKKSLLITVDRWLSDFRDQILSRSAIGRKIQYFYYNSGLDHVEKLLERMAGLLIVICFFCLLLRIGTSSQKIKMRSNDRENQQN